MSRSEKLTLEYEQKAIDWLGTQHDTDEALLALDAIQRLRRELEDARRWYEFVDCLGARYRTAKTMLKFIRRTCVKLNQPPEVVRAIEREIAQYSDRRDR